LAAASSVRVCSPLSGLIGGRRDFGSLTIVAGFSAMRLSLMASPRAWRRTVRMCLMLVIDKPVFPRPAPAARAFSFKKACTCSWVSFASGIFPMAGSM
jgi:hypothetical protein